MPLLLLSLPAPAGPASVIAAWPSWLQASWASRQQARSEHHAGRDGTEAAAAAGPAVSRVPVRGAASAQRVPASCYSLRTLSLSWLTLYLLCQVS